MWVKSEIYCLSLYIGKSRQYWLNENINDSLFIMINDSLY